MAAAAPLTRQMTLICRVLLGALVVSTIGAPAVLHADSGRPEQRSQGRGEGEALPGHPAGAQLPSAARRPAVVGPGVVMARSALFVYQRWTSPTKGQQCPMMPSCSEYARLAVIERGALRGVLMAADRLHRCGHDLGTYPPGSDAAGFVRALDAP